jgi:hypothetical protein
MLSTLAETPALPLHTAGKYVAGAYVVLFALVLVYVGIMAVRMSRIERDLGELLAEADRAKLGAPAQGGEEASPAPPQESSAVAASEAEGAAYR